jgi:hypothetical protein
MGTFNTGSTGGSISAVGSVRDLFTVDKHKVLNLTSGSYTVPAGKTFYMIAAYMVTAAGAARIMYTPSGGSATALMGNINVNTAKVVCDTLPIVGGAAGVYPNALWSYPTPGTITTSAAPGQLSDPAALPASTALVTRVAGWYIHAFPAGTVIANESGMAAQIQGFEV